MRFAVTLTFSAAVCLAAAATAACGSDGTSDVAYAGAGGRALAPREDGGAGGGGTSQVPGSATASDGDAGAPSPAGEAGGPPPGESGPITLTLLDTSKTGPLMGTPAPGYDPIANHATIDEATVGRALSVRANTTIGVGSMELTLDGAYKHSEDQVPFTLCGDDGNGTIANCNLTIGPHIVTATAHSAAGGAGDAGASVTITFTLIDSNAPPDAAAE